MIVLLEGADCSGKTTLANVLCGSVPNTKYFRHDQNNNSINEFVETVREARKHSDKTRGLSVIDRLWLSEIVYGPIMRGHTNDPSGAVMTFCHLMGVVTVCCVRHDITKHLLHFREVEKTRDEYAGSKIEQIIKLYHDLWYGDTATFKHDNPILHHIGRYTPLRMLRSYYQYDMDQYTAEQFTNWLLRANHAN